MTRSTHVVAPSRAVTLVVAATIAGACAWGVGTQAASATPGDPHKVWVCKYVQKPGGAEVLKGGKNPIHVDEASLTNDRGVEPQLGDTFSDGQFRSVVVSLDDEPAVTECPAEVELDSSGVILPGTIVTPTTPAVPATPTTTTATTPAAPVTPTGTPTTTSTETGIVGLGGIEPPATVALAPVPALGDGAPDTGGLGQVADRSGSLDVIVGAGLLAVAGGLLVARARRRRRTVAEVD